MQKEDNSSEKVVKIRIGESRSVLFADILKILDQYDTKREGKFYYTLFEKPDANLEKIIDYTASWKPTKMWINNKEVDDIRGAKRVLFCPYKDKCQGFCKHDLEFHIKEIEYDHPFYNEQVAKYESLEAIIKWFKELPKRLSLSWNERNLIEKLQTYSIIKTDQSSKVFIFSKKRFREYIEHKLNLEFNHCPVLNSNKISDLINTLPKTISVSKELQGRFFEIEEEREEKEENQEDFLIESPMRETKYFISSKKLEFCIYRFKCEGACMLLEFADEKIDTYLKKYIDENGYGLISEIDAWDYSRFFVNPGNNNNTKDVLVSLNKSLLEQFYETYYNNIFDSCKYIDKEKTVKKIHQLPNVLKIVDESIIYRLLEHE